MRLIKMLGLAAIAAVAAMAFIGASSASATVLCKQTPTGSPAKCPAANTYGANTIYKGTDAAAKLTTPGLPTVQCHSEVEIKQINTGGAAETVKANTIGLNFTSCNNGCTVTVEGLPFTGEVHWIEGTHNGTVTTTGSSSVKCPFLACVYSIAGDLLLTGGNPAHITASETKLTLTEKKGFLNCPKEGFWDATYVANGTNAAVWVAKEEE